MSTQPLLPEEILIQRAVEALMKALGPVEAVRFLNLPRPLYPDSVEWHRQWQASLDRERYFDEVFGEDESATV